MRQLLAQGHHPTVSPRPNKQSKYLKLKISPELSETPKSNLLNQPVNHIHPFQATWLMEDHILHHIPSGPFIPPSSAHTQLKLCTLTQANKSKSVQEFDQLLDVFIQQLEVKVMDSMSRMGFPTQLK